MKRGLDLATEFGFHPSFACYEPGFIRLGAALQAVHRGVPQPIYRLMFSNGMSFGFPPKRYALDAYRTLLQSEVPGAPVMIADRKSTRLNSVTNANLVCRLLLEKTKDITT